MLNHKILHEEEEKHMKIGVSSYSFSHYMKQTGCNYLKICDLAKEMGFDGIEFIDLDEKISGKKPMETAREIREHCERIGLEVVAYTVGANFMQAEPAKEVERLKAYVDVAAELGAKILRHDCCDDPHKPGYSWQDAVAEVAPYIRQLTEYAAGKGIRTCTENHGIYFQDSHRVETLIRTVNHPNYGWLVDMGNFLCADEDNVRAVAAAAPYAFHVHAKDFLKKPADCVNPGKGWFRSRGGAYLRGTVVGSGVVPVVQCVFELKRFGYSGFLSLEFEGMEENLPALEAGLDYLRRITE